MIRNITEPKWDKIKGEWVIEYTVVDSQPYSQTVRCETLLSAQNYINLLNQRKER